MLVRSSRFEEALMKDVSSSCAAFGLETHVEQIAASPTIRLLYPTMTPQEIINTTMKGELTPQKIAALKNIEESPPAKNSRRLYRTGNILKFANLSLSKFSPSCPPNIPPELWIPEVITQARIIQKAFKTQFLYGRNEAWLNRVKHFNDPELPPSLIAVGAAHLYGIKGIISLMEKDGWKFARYGKAKNERFRWPVPSNLERLQQDFDKWWRDIADSELEPLKFS